jgi:hypothetical protein
MPKLHYPILGAFFIRSQDLAPAGSNNKLRDR